MSRADKRKMKRLEDWFFNLSSDKKSVIEEYIGIEVEEQVELINQQLDTCISAALITTHHFNSEEIDKVLRLTSEYAIESEPFLVKYKGELELKVKELEIEIKPFILEMLNKGKGKAEIIKAIREDYKEVPNKDIINIYNKTKEEWCIPKQPIQEGYVSEAKIDCKYPNPRNKKKEPEEIPFAEPVEEVIEVAEEVEENVTVPKLKILKKAIELEGEFGHYSVDSDKVVKGDLEFKSIAEVDKFVEVELARFNAEIEELKAVFQYM